MDALKNLARAFTGCAHFLWSHRRLAALALVLVLITWFLRPLWQPVAVYLRIHLFEWVVAGSVAFVMLRAFAVRRWSIIAAGGAVVAGWLFVLYGLNVSPYDYVCLYSRYTSVERQDVSSLPETAHERVQPLNSVRTLSNEVLDDTVDAADPDVVRVEGSYRFTFAIEPSKEFFFRRWTEPVRELMSLPVTSPSFDFSSKSREKVMFQTGEGLALSRNVNSAVIRSLGPLRFWSYEPADVKYLKDDSGEWVQVVSLIHWRGFLAPWPEFGGVVLIRQSQGGIVSKLSTALLGTGEWIRPEDVPKRPFLVGQNIVPYDVSRYLAESFRFKGGFWAPAIGHWGDIRIPDMPEDKNPQPYTVFATWDGEQGKLWHYFGLEPWAKDKQGLALSLFVPADGVGPVRVVSHDDQGMFGVSTVPAKVRESQKVFDWRGNAPVEHRPFIRTVGGKRRFYWLTTIVTFKKGGDGDFIAGAKPEITFTDAASQEVVWANSGNPSSWLAQLEENLRANEAEHAPPKVSAPKDPSPEPPKAPEAPPAQAPPAEPKPKAPEPPAAQP